MTDLDIRTDDDFLVRVKAQVMTRDESTGGWVPLGRGGMSIVGLRQIIITSGDDVSIEYILHGQRIADHTDILSCVLNKDLEYTRANPTFHHWWTGERRYGLTFQSSADARLLERSIRNAVENMLTPPDCSTIDTPITDDDVFMALSLPLIHHDLEDLTSDSESTTSSLEAVSLSLQHHSTDDEVVIHSPITPQCQSPTTPPPQLANNPFRFPAEPSHGSTSHGRAARMYRVRCDSPRSEISLPRDNIEMIDYTYVRLSRTKASPEVTPTSSSTEPTASHHTAQEYTYPSLDTVLEPASLPVSTSTHVCLVSLSGRKHSDVLPRAPYVKHRGWFERLTSTSSHQEDGRFNARCYYCREMFDDDLPGTCEDAPDSVRMCIERVTCMCCARAVYYHCVPADDEEGEHGLGRDPCESLRGGWKRWWIFALLSLAVPCLCCYIPLRTCHRCGVRLGCWGGRHKADTHDDS